MNDHFIVTVFFTIVAACYFNNNIERALIVMGQVGYIPAHRRLSVSRYNRQLHHHFDTVEMCLQLLLQMSCHDGEVFIIDSMPILVCKRKRARRNRKVKGCMFCGYCAAKKEKYFGWKLHLICDEWGLPAIFTMLPASFHDLTPICELSCVLPNGARLFGDKAYNDEMAEGLLAEAMVHLIPQRRKNMDKQPGWAEEYDSRLRRNSQ